MDDGGYWMLEGQERARGGGRKEGLGHEHFAGDGTTEVPGRPIETRMKRTRRRAGTGAGKESQEGSVLPPETAWLA